MCLSFDTAPFVTIYNNSIINQTITFPKFSEILSVH